MLTSLNCCEDQMMYGKGLVFKLYLLNDEWRKDD